MSRTHTAPSGVAVVPKRPLFRESRKYRTHAASFQSTDALAHDQNARAEWSPWRNAIVHFVQHWTFDLLVLLTIILNVFVICIVNVEAFVHQKVAFQWVDNALILVLAVELLARGVALGPLQFMARHWNKVDLLLLVASIVGFALTMSGRQIGVRIGAVRVLRIFRPLKSLKQTGPLRSIFFAFRVCARRLMWAVLLFAVFVVAMTYIGMLFFGDGALNHRCVPLEDVVAFVESKMAAAAASGNTTADSDAGDVRDMFTRTSLSFEVPVCYLSAFPSGYDTSNSTAAAALLANPRNRIVPSPPELPEDSRGRVVCPFDELCVEAVSPGFGYFNFDSFLQSIMSAYVFIVGEPMDMLYYMMDSMGAVVCIYSVVLTIVGSLFLLNLILVIIMDGYSRIVEEQDSLEEEEEQQKLKHDLSQETRDESEEERLARLSGESTVREELAEKGIGGNNGVVVVADDLYDSSQVLSPLYGGSQGSGEYSKFFPRNNRQKYRLSLHKQEDDSARDPMTLCARAGSVALDWISSKAVKLDESKTFRRRFFAARKWLLSNVLVKWWWTAAIVCVILLNTIALATVHYGMSATHRRVLSALTIVFTVIYVLEAVVRLLVVPLSVWKHDAMNYFDLFMTVVAVVECIVDEQAVVGALRCFRLLRLLTVIPAMRRTMYSFVQGLRQSASLLVFFLTVLIVLSVASVQFFQHRMCELGGTASPEFAVNTTLCDAVPRANYDSFVFAFPAVLNMATGEGVHSLLTLLELATGSEAAGLFVVVCRFFGGYLILNLTVAVLTESLSSSHPSESGDGSGAESEEKLPPPIPIFADTKEKEQVLENASSGQHKSERSNSVAPLQDSQPARVEGRRKQPWWKWPWSWSSSSSSPSHAAANGERSLGGGHGPDGVEMRDVLHTPLMSGASGSFSTAAEHAGTRTDAHPLHTLPFYVTEALKEGMGGADSWRTAELGERRAGAIQGICLVIVSSQLYKCVMVLLVILSVFSGMFYRPLLPPDHITAVAQGYCDIAIAVVFALDVVLQFVGRGKTNYFANPWRPLELLAVICFIICAAMFPFRHVGGGAVAYRPMVEWLRLARFIRPLPLVSYSTSASIVLACAVRSLVALRSAFVSVLIVWFAFSVTATQLFYGRAFACMDKEWGDVTFSAPHLTTMDACIAEGYSWVSAEQNFNNIGESLVTVFQITTSASWDFIISLSTDGVSDTQAPTAMARPWVPVIYIAYIVVAAFIMVDYFTAVLVDTYFETMRLIDANILELRKQYRQRLLEESWLNDSRNSPVSPRSPVYGRGSPTSPSSHSPRSFASKEFYAAKLTEEESDFFRMFRRAILFVRGPLPQTYDPRSLAGRLRYFVRSRYYQYLFVIAVVVNVLVEVISFEDERVNSLVLCAFASLFLVLQLCKYIVYRNAGYWRHVTSWVDLLINVSTFSGGVIRLVYGPVLATNILEMLLLLRLYYFALVSSTLLMLLQAAADSLWNAFVVLIIVVDFFFVCTYVAQILFGRVTWDTNGRDGFFRWANFDDFGLGLLTLIRVCIEDNWWFIMYDSAISGEVCDPQLGDCGIPVLAPILFVLFMIVGNWIGLSLFTAVILGSFNEMEKEDRFVVRRRHVRRFGRLWKRCARTDTSKRLLFMHELCVFLMILEPPIGVPSLHDHANANASGPASPPSSDDDDDNDDAKEHADDASANTINAQSFWARITHLAARFLQLPTAQGLTEATHARERQLLRQLERGQPLRSENERRVFRVLSELRIPLDVTANAVGVLVGAVTQSAVFETLIRHQFGVELPRNIDSALEQLLASRFAQNYNSSTTTTTATANNATGIPNGISGEFTGPLTSEDYVAAVMVQRQWRRRRAQRSA